MVKFCSNCGQELDDDAAFCMECGTKIDGSSKSSSAKNNIDESINKFSENVNESFDNLQNLFDVYKISMMKDEKIIKRSQIHIGIFIAPIIFSLFWFLIFLMIPSLGMFLFFLLSLVWLVIRFIAYKNNELILTNKRVFGKVGLISTTQMQSPLNMINSVAYSNGIIGKLLGYGTVHVVTASTLYKFRFIRDGQTLYGDIFQQLELAEKEKLQAQAEAIADAIAKKR